MSYVGTSRSSSSSCSRQRTETSGQQAAVPKFLLLWPGLRCSWTRRADMATVSTATFPCLDRRKLKAINTAFSVSRLYYRFPRCMLLRICKNSDTSAGQLAFSLSSRARVRGATSSPDFGIYAGRSVSGPAPAAAARGDEQS